MSSASNALLQLPVRAIPVALATRPLSCYFDRKNLASLLAAQLELDCQGVGLSSVVVVKTAISDSWGVSSNNRV